jgi:hypothetical protein
MRIASLCIAIAFLAAACGSPTQRSAAPTPAASPSGAAVTMPASGDSIDRFAASVEQRKAMRR